LIKPFNEHQLAVAVDVALEIHRIEKELTFNQARLTKMQKIAGLGYWEWYEENETIKLSENMLGMLGLGDEFKIISVDQIREMIHPDDVKDTREVINSYQENFLRTERISLRLKTSSGEYKTFEATPIAMELDGEEPDTRVMVGALYDVTDRLQMKKSQVQREAMLRTVNGINQAALSSQNLDEVFEVLHGILTEHFSDFDSCFYLYDNILNTGVWDCHEDSELEKFQELIQDKIDFSAVLEEKIPKKINITQKSLIRQDLKNARESACWVFPLISGEKQLGIWFVINQEDNIFPENFGKDGKVSRIRLL
jgi:hypothetical protein